MYENRFLIDPGQSVVGRGLSVLRTELCLQIVSYFYLHSKFVIFFSTLTSGFFFSFRRIRIFEQTVDVIADVNFYFLAVKK